MEFHVPEEFVTAMAALPAAGLARLRKVRRILARPPMMDGCDLMQELHARVLGGTRRWRIGDDVLKFAVQTMRSIADEAAQRGRRERVSLSPSSRQSGEVGLMGLGVVNRDGVVDTVQQPATPEDDIGALEEGRLLGEYRRRALAVLADDETAQLLLEGMCDGLRGRDLQELTGLGDTEFDTKKRFVRRRLERLERDGEDGRRSA